MAEQKKNKKNGKKSIKRMALFQPGELVYGPYEYKMSKESAWNILHDPITGKQIPGDEAKLLCDYVNEQCGLMGTCVSVLVG